MTGIGEMLASAVVDNVCEKLVDLLADELTLLWNFKDDMEYMKVTLESIQAVLCDAERRSLRKEAESERLWLKRLKFAAHEIHDLLCDFEFVASIPPQMTRRRDKAKLFFSSSNPLISRVAFAHNIKDLKEKLDTMISERRHFDLDVDTGSNKLLEDLEIKNRETFSEIVSNKKMKIVGRNEEKEKIVDFLLQRDVGDVGGDVSTIPIVGLGGLGKTTLAQLVFNDENIEQEFDIRAWVYVSMDFDLLNIGRTILLQIDSGGKNHDNLESVSRHLKSALANKRILIVLDDLWEEDGQKLERLNIMLKGGKYDTKVIVTTRSHKVALLMSSKNAMVHSLMGLSDEDCWCIFSQRAFISGDEVDSSLKEIGREIIKKCKGVPLAAIALGYILCSKKDIVAWSAMRDSEFWELDDDGVLPSLKLSYYQLPPPLKLCFAYCAIFPKGFDINKDKLIQQWIALQFIKETNGNFTPENIGEEYVSMFLGMSFLQYSPNYDGSQNLLRMHDLVHDLARSVVGDEMIVLDGKKDTNRDINLAICYSYYGLLINYDNMASSPDWNVLPDKIRALHFTSCTSMLFPDKVFSQRRYLRVLKFGRYHMENLPDSVYRLKQLRYLEASLLNAKSLPESFGNLLNMETLYLSQSSLVELPTSINKLRKLNNLSLHGCSLLRILPESFTELKVLTYLDLSNCCSLQSLPKTFGNLSRLCFLQLSGCSELPNLPQSFSNLESLEHLNLSLCNKLDKIPECFGNLKKLKFLNLSSCIALRNIPGSFGPFPNLEKFDLSYCHNLEKFPESILGSDKLKMLDLRGSNLIKFAINAEIFGNTQEGFVLLNDEMFECKEIGQGGKLCSTIVWLEHLNQIRGKLHITHVETVHSSEDAKRAKLCNKSELGSLTLQWSSSTSETSDSARGDELVLEKLQPHRNLELLTIDGYRGTRLPSWVTGLENSLPYLTQLTLNNLTHCEQFPPFEYLTNIEILEIHNIPKIKRVDTDMQPSSGSFRKLKILSIRDMPNLQEWSINTGSTYETKLERLEINRCPHVVIKPCLPSTKSFDIIESNMALSWADVESLSFKPRISKLNIESCRITSDEWEGLGGHVNIKDLNIKSCEELYFLPKGILGLTSLESLTIDNCNSLSVLPEWLGELVSLRSLSIINCLDLKSLPSSIQGLTALKNLHIGSCSPLLVNRCLGVDKNTISHVRNVYIPHFTLAFCERSEEVYHKMAYCGELGMGAFGPTYKTVLRDGQVVAVKSLKKLKVNTTAMVDQFRALGAMNHTHLVRLHACITGPMRSSFDAYEPHLVYAFMPMGSLFAWLKKTDFPHFKLACPPLPLRSEVERLEWRQQLQWKLNIISRIIHDVAHGLKYIHSIYPRCAHGNITTTNVLVFGDKDYPKGAKITNYGLANLIGGPATSGYTAPELIDFSQATQKSDVYSFGVLLLEVLTGWEPEHGGKASVPGWVKKDFHDHSNENPIATQAMNQMLQLAIQCVSSKPESRPKMDSVARRIEKMRNLLKTKEPIDIGSPDSYGSDKIFFLGLRYFE